MATVNREIGVSWRFARQPVQEPVWMAEQLRERGLISEADELARKCNSVLLSRGRRPTRGCVLMLKQDYDKIVRPHDCRHKLVINAEEELLVERLCVTKVIALVPGFEPLSPSQIARRTAQGKQQLLPEIVDTTPVIVEFADARHYASEFSGIDKSFNLRKPTGERYRNTQAGIGDIGVKFSYKALCNEIWDERDENFNFIGLRGLFGVSLTFFVDAELFEIAPENFQFLGISAWDALWVVLDLAGWTFFFDDFQRPTIIQLGDPIDNVQHGRIISGATHRTIVDAGNVQDDFLPARIHVTTTQRNYQFQAFSEQTITSGDHYSRFPTVTEEFGIDELISESSQKHPVASGTVKQLWGAVPLFFDDTGVAANRLIVLQHLKDIALRYLRHINEGQIEEFEWFGLRLLRPSKFFSGILFRDHGGLRTLGLNSAIGEPEWIDGAIKWELTWSAEEARPGALTRDAVPYGREIYGLIVDTVPSSSGPNRFIEPNEFCQIVPQKGEVDQEGVSWFGNFVAPQNALNGTGKPIRVGRQCFAKWNYQLSVGGEWLILIVHGAQGGEGEPPDDGAPSIESDWEARCIEGTPVSGASEDGLTVVNRRSMLRLIRPSPPKDGEVSSEASSENLPEHLKVLIQSEETLPEVPESSDKDSTEQTTGVRVDFQHGPPNTVLWTSGGNPGRNEQSSELNTIYWTNGPTLATLVLGGPLQFQRDGRSSLHAPRGGTIDMRLPKAASRSDQFLISSAVSGTCTETEFFGPGKDCTIKLATECFDVDGFMDYFCEFVNNCLEFGNPFGTGLDPENPFVSDCKTENYTFKKGILFEGPSAKCTTPSQRFGASCEPGLIRHWNPCRDENSPGEPP